MVQERSSFIWNHRHQFFAYEKVPTTKRPSKSRWPPRRETSMAQVWAVAEKNHSDFKGTIGETQGRKKKREHLKQLTSINNALGFRFPFCWPKAKLGGGVFILSVHRSLIAMKSLRAWITFKSNSFFVKRLHSAKRMKASCQATAATECFTAEDSLCLPTANNRLWPI